MNLEDAKEALNLFANKTNIYAELYDAQGGYICAYGDKTKLHISDTSQTATYSEQGNFTFSNEIIGNLYEYEYKFSISNQEYKLFISGNDTETVNDSGNQ